MPPTDLAVHRQIPDGLATMTQLRKQGLQPGGDIVATFEYWTAYGYLRANLYRVDEARPIDHAYEYQLRKQQTADREARRTRLKESWDAEYAALERDTLDEYREDRAKAVATFRAWAADPNVVYLDTETTGVQSGDEVVEVAVVGQDGTVLFESLVRPTVNMSPEASAINGLTDADLQPAPGFAEIWPRLREVLDRKTIVAFAARFDAERLMDSLDAACGAGWRRGPDDEGRSEQLRQWHEPWHCAMLAFAPLYGEYSRNSYRWPKLKYACQMVGVAPEADIHRAAGGAHALRQLVQATAAHEWPVPELLDVPHGMLPDGADVGWWPEEAPGWK